MSDVFLHRHTVFSMTGLVALVLAACAVEGEADSNRHAQENIYQLGGEIRGEPPVERTWVEGNVERIATISEGEDYFLYQPVDAWILEDGNIYIWDGGDYKLKAFSPEGTLMQEYGKGQGEGPGEVEGYRSIGFWQDSLYVLDRHARRASFFAQDGTFGRSKPFDGPIADFHLANDSLKYELYMGDGEVPLFVDITESSGRTTESSGRTTRVPVLQSRDLHFIVLRGYLFPASGRAVYVPNQYPVLLAFAPGDSVAAAYPTPDYGEAPMPATERIGDGVLGGGRISTPTVQYMGTMHRNVLTVQLASTEDDVAFDVYDTREMEYKHSVRLPIANAHARYAYEAGFVVALRDTTVDVYRVEDFLEASNE